MTFRYAAESLHDAQRILSALGYDVWVNGSDTEHWRARLKGYQWARGARQTGALDDVTRAYLESDAYRLNEKLAADEKRAALTEPDP